VRRGLTCLEIFTKYIYSLVLKYNLDGFELPQNYEILFQYL